jgi:hypothetical protein
MVRRGLDLLTARIGDSALPDETVVLRGELMVRRSARRPPAWATIPHGIVEAREDQE